MSMFSIFNVSGSAISSQAQRLNVVASNLANADAVAGPDGQGYKARQVVFETVPMGSEAAAGVKVSSVRESQEPLKRVHNPSHPSADVDGYVTQSNVMQADDVPNSESLAIENADEFKAYSAAMAPALPYRRMILKLPARRWRRPRHGSRKISIW